MKSLYSMLTFCTIIFSANGQILFQSDFTSEKPLAQWRDFSNSYNSSGVAVAHPPAPPKIARVIEENGEIFMRTEKTTFCLTHAFSKAVKVDSNLKRIVLEAVFRQKKENLYSVNSFILTSRSIPAADAGGAFWRGRDSGIGVSGYSGDAQMANRLFYRREGTDICMYKSVTPYSLFSAPGKWQLVRLCYDNVKKTLSFECDGREPVVMRKVDLDGLELNSLAISCQNNDYKSVKVSRE